MTETRTHDCPDANPRDVSVRWDPDALAFVQTEQCPDCGVMFEVFEE